jgi:hypothetical protein
MEERILHSLAFVDTREVFSFVHKQLLERDTRRPIHIWTCDLKCFICYRELCLCPDPDHAWRYMNIFDAKICKQCDRDLGRE